VKTTMTMRRIVQERAATTSSPNRNNPYSKFEEWSAWRKNDVDKKVVALKDEIAKLKEKMGSTNNHHKGKQGAKLITSL